MVNEYSDANYEEVLLSPKTVLFYFWAPWCREACRFSNKEIEHVAKRFEGSLLVGKVNIDQGADAIVAKYGVQNLPVFLIFKNGTEIDKQMGLDAKSYERFIHKIKSHLD